MELNYKEVFSFENLYNSYKKCCKGVNWKTSTKNFKFRAIQNITKLQKELYNKTYKSKGFTCFTIRERGKLRDIKSVNISERVVQRCLCDYWLVPLLSKSLIYDSGATIKGKGLNFTYRRLKCHLQKFGRKNKSGYILIFDYSKYFESINHELLLEKVNKVTQNKELFELYKYFVNNFGNKGLGLGSQISQISALFYLSEIDHKIKEELKCKFYGRYMDDGYIIANNINFLKWCRLKIIQYSETQKLNLSLRKTRIEKLTHFTFLKKHWKLKNTLYVVIKPLHTNIKRLRRKIKIITQKNKETLKQFLQSIKGYFKIFSNRRLMEYVL